MHIENQVIAYRLLDYLISVKKIQLTHKDVQHIKAAIATIDLTKYGNKPIEHVVALLGNVLYNRLRTYKNYIVLDSRYRLLDGDNNASPFSIMKWVYNNISNSQQGSVRTLGAVSNITEIKLYQPRIPSIPNLNRVSVNILEFNAQSYIMYNNAKAHWLLQPIYDNTNMMELAIDNFSDGIYKFDPPIQVLNTLSVQFGNPHNVITFPIDRAKVISMTPVSSNTLLQLNTTHGFTGDTLCIFSNFTTSNPNADYATIAKINSSLNATIINSTTLSIAVNTTTLQGTTNAFDVYFAERQICLYLEFTYKGE